MLIKKNTSDVVQMILWSTFMEQNAKNEQILLQHVWSMLAKPNKLVKVSLKTYFLKI